MNSFYSEDELLEIGLKSLGRNVLISKKTSFYGAENIEIGNNVRIDDFCILSGKIIVKNFIHIAAYSALFGGDKGIFIGDYSNISSRNCIYAISDDFSGSSMTNPMVSGKYKQMIELPVVIGRHVIVGSCCTVLPGTNIHDGCSFGAMCLIKGDYIEWKVYCGIPAVYLRERSKALLKYEKDMERENE